MKILKIKWKNFNSFGNKVNILDLTSGKNSLNLISGKNGTGKSTICQILGFCLYGKVPGKNIGDLPNQINKNLECELEFLSGENIIRIKRGVSPDIFEIYENDTFSKLNDIPNKISIQKELERKFVKIPEQIFRNIISLDINNLTSFLKLSPQKKREIIDELFDLRIYNKYFEKNKLRFKNLQSKKDNCLSKISDYERFIRDEEIKNNTIIESNLTEDENEQNIKLKEFIKLFKDNSSVIEQYETDLKNIEINSDDCRNIINTKTILMKQSASKYKELNHDKCPICGNDISGEFFVNIKKDLKNEVLKYKEDIEKAKKNISENDIKCKDLLSEKNIKNKENKSIRNDIIKLRDSLKENSIKSSQNIENIEINIKKFNEEKEKIKQELIEIDKKIEINKILSIIFSEEGFKKSILNNIVPSLNNNIEKLLTLLNINFEMTFNNLFQIKIKNNGLEISENTLSTGENKKLNLIIIFSLYILLKYQYGDINILFLDEVFAGLDMNSQDTIIEILNRLKSFLDINIFIIHHNDFEECNFDRILYTKKENQFSELAIIEN